MLDFMPPSIEPFLQIDTTKCIHALADSLLEAPGSLSSEVDPNLSSIINSACMCPCTCECPCTCIGPCTCMCECIGPCTCMCECVSPCSCIAPMT